MQKVDCRGLKKGGFESREEGMFCWLRFVIMLLTWCGGMVYKDGVGFCDGDFWWMFDEG